MSARRKQRSKNTRQRGYGRVLTEPELRAALADLETLPMGGSAVLDVSWSLPPHIAAAVARTARSAEHDHGDGVE